MSDSATTTYCIRPDVQTMHAYAVADASGLIKLDAMENPFVLPNALQEALGKRLGQLAINRYPGAETQRLRKALLQHYQPPENYDVVLGNGSDELIAIMATAVLKTASAMLAASAHSPRPATMLAPQPGFVMYQITAQLLGLNFIGVALQDNFELDTAAMLAAIEQHQPEIIFLAYPNNPTGTQWTANSIAQCIAAAASYGGLVVLDEAYQPFANATWLDQVKAAPQDNRNVVIMRTMSKFGLAGARLGYLFAPNWLAQQFDKVRPAYNISVLNAECALFALEHADIFSQQAAILRAERDRLNSALQHIPQIQTYPSQGNMILIRCKGASDQATIVHAAMKKMGILVKNVSTMHPMLANCLRLTVGTPQENTAMLNALQSAFKD